MRQRPPVTRPRATQALEISVQGCRLEFIPVPMRFGRCGMANVFAGLNNKTLAETLFDKRYAKLSEEIRCHYPNSLNDRLGEFLYRLKIGNDGFYRRFLNKHGDNVFCDFSIERTSLSETRASIALQLATRRSTWDRLVIHLHEGSIKVMVTFGPRTAIWMASPQTAMSTRSLPSIWTSFPFWSAQLKMIRRLVDWKIS